MSPKVALASLPYISVSRMSSVADTSRPPHYWRTEGTAPCRGTESRPGVPEVPPGPEPLVSGPLTGKGQARPGPVLCPPSGPNDEESLLLECTLVLRYNVTSALPSTPHNEVWDVLRKMVHAEREPRPPWTCGPTQDVGPPGEAAAPPRS